MSIDFVGTSSSQEYTEPYIPVNENYGVVKFTPSINELSINIGSGRSNIPWFFGAEVKHARWRR